MAIIMKTLVTLVLTIFFVISCVHCRTISTISPGVGIEDRKKCFKFNPCERGGDRGCTAFCRRQKAVYSFGTCTKTACCCVGR
ncbi:hypothetical protein Bca4012_077224 [Brassica carinata]|uniref:Uncharacterized protein n=3 Tax=Brassica TaxID=3705 RepID=A0ABQ7YMR1_BRANA|nr:hypothetical protein HID58_075595 [Brassica napus]CDY12487.1 BnaC07g13270D [Brassica napus]VDD37031.1 unnamed protein product [Brassica oleracea]